MHDKLPAFRVALPVMIRPIGINMLITQQADTFVVKTNLISTSNIKQFDIRVTMLMEILRNFSTIVRKMVKPIFVFYVILLIKPCLIACSNSSQKKALGVDDQRKK